MNFHEKYIKYKKKYLNYKKKLQFGGSKPLNNIIKNINLFTNPDMEQYLNPIYGFLMCETDYIVHNYDLYDKDFIKTNDSEIIKNISKRLPETIKPLHEIINHGKPIDIGRYIALLYICKNNVNFIRYGQNKFIFDKIDKFKYKFKRDASIVTQCETDIVKLTKFINTIKLIKNNIKFNTKERIDFYILLYCLWWIVNNKNGIKEYYDGINEVFNIVNKYLGEEKSFENIIIPSDFISSVFIHDDTLEKPNNDSFELCLFKITERFIIFDQEKSSNFCYPKFVYPDCGETTARNLINLICFNDNKFDIEILKKLGATDELIEYYTTFNDFASQSSVEVSCIYNDKLNPRDAWSKLILNFANKNLVFIYGCPCDKCKRFELNSGLSLDNETTNFFQLIKNLLSLITSWNDLINNDITDITVDLDNNGKGTIILNHKMHEQVTIGFEKFHYYMKIEKKIINYDYSHINNDIQKNFLNILTKNIEINKNNYLWINYTPELFLDEYYKDEEDENGEFMESKIKKELLELSSTYKFDSYLRRNIIINVERDLKFVINKKIEFNDYRYEGGDNFDFVKRIPNLQSLAHTFLNIDQITQIDLSPLSNIINIDHFLSGCEKLKNINLSPLTNVKTIGDAFLRKCNSLTNIDLSPLKNVTSIENEFLYDCRSLTSIDLSPLKNITIIGNSFLNACYRLTNIDLSPFKNITSIGNFFLSDCKSLTYIDLTPLKNITIIFPAFLINCINLKYIDMSPLINVKIITDACLEGCTSLTSIDISFMKNLKRIDEDFLYKNTKIKEIICTCKQKELFMINNPNLIDKIVIKN
jgi:hypothetical protein